MRKENIESISINIGNYLSGYFFRIGKAILERKNFYMDVDTIDFVKYLPNEIIFDDSDIFKQIYKSFEENGVTKDNTNFAPTAEWFIQNDNHIQFWICMKPLISEFLDNAFKKSGLNVPIDCPIIHFRCSDVPFARHSQYHLHKYEFYKKALDTVKEKSGLNYNKIKLMYTGQHLSNNYNVKSCDKYVFSLKQYLEDLNYEVEIYSNSNIDDFANLFYAPVVISTIGSYSFMSGFFGKGIYITTQHLSEENENTNCNLCDEWMIKGYQIKHNTVVNYHDTETVIKMLKQ